MNPAALCRSTGFPILFCLLLILSAAKGQAQDELGLIPRPTSCTVGENNFEFRETTRITYPKKREWKDVASLFQTQLLQSSGMALKAGPGNSKGNTLQFKEVNRPALGREGYELKVSPDGIQITANTAQGAFYGLQTLLQLLPPAIFDTSANLDIAWTVPEVHITDVPRFAYRGLHLDVARHYFPVSFIKRYLDLMALHKMNQFHWHLTDDQGWRIEINAFPLLTEIGSVRSANVKDTTTYGGFYSQKEVKEIIRYAKKKHINIIPEIDIPGHTTALLAAYPIFGDSARTYTVGTRFGRYYDVLMPYDTTFRFLAVVLKEVADLFPGEYIHIGGDEAHKSQWTSHAFTQTFMKEKGMKHVNEIQSYFIHFADSVLTSLGKKMIGWDEILQGGLSPNATVMSWQGTEGGIAAAGQQRPVIMSPLQHCYLNFYQFDPKTTPQPIAYNRILPLTKVYAFDPIPAALADSLHHLILGVQGNLWTEYISDTSLAEYMAWPRAAAISEIGWSAQGQRDLENFQSRWEIHQKRLNVLKVNYYGAPVNAHQPVVTNP